MTLKKSNYNILMYLAKNIEMKASLGINLTYGTSICYLPEMDVFVEFYESSHLYRIQKLNLTMNMLGKKYKSSWNVEKLNNLDQRIIQQYIQSNGTQEVFVRSDFGERN